jgi:hypothetical protein
MAKKDQIVGYMIDNAVLVDGKLDGVKVHCQWDTKNDAHQQFTNSCWISFAGITLKKLLAYACATLIIRRQAQERLVKYEEAVTIKGKVVHWATMGHKIVSAEKQFELVSANVEQLDKERARRLYEQLKEQFEAQDTEDEEPEDEQA